MSFMQKLKRLSYKLTSKTAMIVIGLIALSLVVWFGGPLIAIAGSVPLASAGSRFGTIMLIILVLALVKLYQIIQQNKRNAQMTDHLLEGDDSNDEVNEELDTLKERMTDAINVLKSTKLSQGKSVYQLPWYIMIGPPGAGKTTAINNSGLDYPLKESLGIDVVHGIGGTRNCDWWFTNKAVLIDTAGRYTTQDSHARHDSRAWLGFLGLLRKYRPQRPINGVVISMGISELMNQTKTERNLHARAVKQRLQELQSQLGMSFPVYVILSKADLIEGFREFFSELTEEECQQVWGVTFELDFNNESPIEQFNKEFHTLIANLTNLLNRRMSNERDQSKRAKIFEFPRQLRVLQGVAFAYLKEIFTPNAYEELPIFRGVYLSSATQEGLPANFLDNQSDNKEQHINHGRSFFIKRLLEDVVFPEQNLASTNKHHEKQNKWFRRGAIAIAATALLGFSTSWYLSYSWNKDLVNVTEDAVASYELISDTTFDQKNTVLLNERLNALRALPAGVDGNYIETNTSAVGFDKLDDIQMASIKAYRRSLQTYLEPYMATALTEDMAMYSDHLSYLYETLRTYLMLHMPEHFEKDDVMAWFGAYFERNLPGEVNDQTRAQLLVHIDSLLDTGFLNSTINNNAVANARNELTKLPIAERAYQRLQADFLESSISDFRLTDIISYESAREFSFRSGADITKGIPGLYTYNGFHGIFNIEKKKMLGNLLASNWVYGEDATQSYDISKEEIEKKLEQRYFQDYIFYWESFLDDLGLNQYYSTTDGVRITSVLSGPEAPIKNIIEVAQKNTRLTQLPISENQKQAGKIAANATEVAMQTKANRLKRFLPSEKPKFEVKLPGYEVEEAFADLLKIETSQLDDIQKSLRSLNLYITKLDRGDQLRNSIRNQINGQNKPESIKQLEYQGKNLPYPFNMWVLDLTADTTSITRNSTHQLLNDIWRNKVLREYNAAITDRYPFTPFADKEVSMKDFARFFGPEGTLDSFFNNYIAPSVNTSSSPWRFEKNIGVSDRTLAMFEQAAKIREAFFDLDTKKPHIEFGIKPIKLDRNISSIMLEIDGQSMLYRHGPEKVTKIIWPGESAQSRTRIVFTPPNGGRSINRNYEGEWSLYRMLDDLSQQREETREDLQLHFSMSGYNAEIQMLPKTTMHPFWSASIENFSCPTKL